MTQEDKELLLKDLCARLPYGVKAEITAHNLDYEEDFGKVVIAEVYGIQTPKDDDGNLHPCVITCYDKYKIQGNDIESIKPYLRLMSSMTQEEIDEYDAELDKDMDIVINGSLDKDRYITSDGKHTFSKNFVTHFGNDWLNKKGFDYRGLIEKGLALEAPKGMYKTQ